MQHQFPGRLAGLGLAVAWVCTGAPSVVAQQASPTHGAPAALRGVSTTATGRPPTALMQGYRRAADRRVVLVIRPGRELSPAQVTSLVSEVHYQPFRLIDTALSADARDELARRDPRALARIDRATRTRASSAALSRRVPVRRIPTRAVEGIPVLPNDVVVETVEVPPPDVRLIVGTPQAVDTPLPTVRSWEPPPPARVVAIVDTLRIGATACGVGCTAQTIGLSPSLPVDVGVLRRALRVVDVTDPSAERVVIPAGDVPNAYPTTGISLVDLGYRDLRAGRRYLLRVDALTSTTGQPLAAPWFDAVTPALREALATVGNRHDAVWEAGLGPRLPVVTRSLRDVRAGAAPIAPEHLSAAFAQIDRAGLWSAAPQPSLATIPIPGTDDAVRAPLVDVSTALAPDGFGFLWLVAKAGAELPRPGNVVTVHPPSLLPSGVLVQVTNIGVTVRTLDDSVLVFATTLDTGVPVAGASVSILDHLGHPLWRGATDAQGVARTDAGGASLEAGVPSLVLVERAGDRAFAQPIAGWGVTPWLGRSRSEALEGVVLTDRGVYRPGEHVRVKAILRRRDANRMVALATGTPIALTLDRGTARLATLEGRVGAGGGVEWTVPIAASTELGSDYVLTVHAGRPDPPRSRYERERRLTARIAIKEVRPLEFEVDATLTRGPTAGTAGEPRGSMELRIVARDLTGVPLRSGRVAWTLRHEASSPFEVPGDYEAYAVRTHWGSSHDRDAISGEGRLDGGVLTARLDMPPGLEGLGYVQVDAEVIDGDSAQAVATTLTAVVHPDAYLALSADAGTEAAPRASVRVVALGPDGRPVAGIPVALIARSPSLPGGTLPPVHAVTRAEPVEVLLPGLDRAVAWSVDGRVDEAGRLVSPASAAAHVVARALIPSAAELSVSFDKPRYAIGEHAKVTVRPPWSAGTALVTIERHRIVSHHVLPIAGEPLVIDVPIGDDAAGGLVVSAIAVRGRTAACCADDGADPGAPAVANAVERIVVDPASSRLRVAIDALTPAPGPGAPTRWRVVVSDATRRPVGADVTLWAVDEGWLRLSDFGLPDVAATLLERELPFVADWDSRRVLLRRAIPEPYGQPLDTVAASRAGADGVGPGEARVRADRRPLAFWFGDLATGADGTVTVEATLPETLTTYRVFAVAAAPARFGQATQGLVVTSPVMVRPSLPRFLTRGDRATIPVMAASLQNVPARGRLSIESLTPDLLAIDGEPPAIALAPGERRTITIGVRALGAGQARIRVRLATAAAADAVEHTFPIVAPVILERTAVTGHIEGTASAVLSVPRTGVEADLGGLSVSVSASLLAGVALAGSDLEGYAYLCLEQRTSRMLALALAAKEGGPFAFTPVQEPDPAKGLQRALRELPAFRCAGQDATGYGLWNGACRVSSPYLSAYLLFALQTIRAMEIPGIEVDDREIAWAADAVDAALRAPAPTTATGVLSDGWVALGLKVLADEGRYPAAAGAALLAQRDRLPLWAIAHLYDALARAEPGRREEKTELAARLVAAIAPGGLAAPIAAPADRFDWAWPTHVKTTAIVLDVLARHGRASKEQARVLATGLMQQRRADGGWVSTQENAWALVALATYRRDIEGEDDEPVMVTAALAGAPLLEAELRGEHGPATRDVPMRDLVSRLGAADQASLAFTAKGERPAFFTTRLEVRRPAADQPPLARGVTVTRRYQVRTGDRWTPATTVTAGDVIRVSLTVGSEQSRFLVALSDPLPAGFEAIDPELASTAAASRGDGPSWSAVFDHVQRRDGRVDAFATRFPAGETTFEYIARATTVGTFFAAPPHAGPMYETDVFGRGSGATITVKPAP